MRIPDGPWECRFNVFSNTYNSCSAPQEEMPSEPQNEPEELTADEIMGGLGLDVVEEGGDTLFTVSTCTCAVCTEMNAAVREWPALMAEPSCVPLLQCVMRSITATEPLARRYEEDKRFLYAPDKQAVPSADKTN